MLGALIGGITAVASAALTSVVTYWNERGNRDEARQSANIAALRQQISLAFAELFAIQHALNWITWFAEHDEASVDAEMVRACDAEVHAEDTHFRILDGEQEIALHPRTTSQPITRFKAYATPCSE